MEVVGGRGTVEITQLNSPRTMPNNRSIASQPASQPPRSDVAVEFTWIRHVWIPHPQQADPHNLVAVRQGLWVFLARVPSSQELFVAAAVVFCNR